VHALYAVEKQAGAASVAERLKLRQERSAPVLADLRQRFLVWKEQLLPKHPMAEAINYALGQWTELNVFCSDGAVAIDNNIATAARGSGDVMPTAGLCRVRQPRVMIYREPVVITGSRVGIIIGSPGRRGEGPGAGIGRA
jgi:hypothetical protein